MTAIRWQRLEGALVFAAALLAVAVQVAMIGGRGWWLYLILFFAPDLGMIGYLAGPKVGAAVYNTLHLYGLGLLLAVTGLLVFGNVFYANLGLLWMAHIGFDRMLGYGLKEPTAFTDTHLGKIGRR